MSQENRPRRLGLLFASGLALLALPVLLALSPAPATNAQQDAPNRYLGAAKCKNCHQAKEAGDQFGVWMQQKHAKAFDELATDKAKTLGKDKGVADPQTSDKCLKCHVTAYTRPKAELHRSFDPKLGVQCETCHGPGEKHMKARMAAAAAVDEKAPKPAYTVIPDGEVIKTPEAKTCVECHNDESPGYKPFCFHKFLSELRHLNPLKPRTDAEKAAMLVCGCNDQCVCKKGSPDGKCTMPPTASDKKEQKK